MIKYFKNKKGFTFAELIVSIAIIAIILSLLLVNYHYTSKRSELNITKQKVISDIRLAQSYSLSSKTYNDVNIPPGGWGVHFDKSLSNYIIFADKNEDEGYDVDEAEKIESLPSGISISSINIGGGENNEVDIVFLPPDPVTFINGLSDSSVEITLEENQGQSNSTILVNFFGLIDAVD